MSKEELEQVPPLEEEVEITNEEAEAEAEAVENEFDLYKQN